METEKELNEKIMAITTIIREKHPELAEQLNEMPVTIPNENNPQINVSVLKEYLESLNKILKEYNITHLPDN